MDNSSTQETKADVKTWFSILRNLYIYYRLGDLDALSTDLVHNRFKIPPSNTLVYVLGLALRQKPDRVADIYRNHLCKLPPWLLYGALWYAGIPETTTLLKQHATPEYVPEPYTKVAALYAKHKLPIQPNLSAYNALELPKATTAEQRQHQQLEELWAQWYASGVVSWVALLMKTVRDRDTLVEISKAAHKYHTAAEVDATAQDASAANLMMDVVCRTREEKMFMGSLVYDRRLYEFVNKLAAAVNDE